MAQIEFLLPGIDRTVHGTNPPQERELPLMQIASDSVLKIDAKKMKSCPTGRLNRICPGLDRWLKFFAVMNRTNPAWPAATDLPTLLIDDELCQL